MTLMKLLIAALISLVPLAYGQDVLQADPQHSKLLYEDAQVRVVRTELPPGARSPMHSHPERMVSFVTDARLQIETANGESREVVISAGTSQHLLPMTHTVTNIGTETFVEISTEMKTVTHVAPPPPDRQHEYESSVVQTNSIPDTKRDRPAPTVSGPPDQGTPKPVQRFEGGPTHRPEVTVEGATLVFYEAGQGPALVLIHDMFQDYREWQPLFDHLALRFHVIAYSRRDHYPNRTLDGGARYTYDQHAKDLLELIRALGGGPVSVIGDRDGGAIALIAAARQPAAFRALVVIEPNIESLLPADKAFGARGARNEIFRIVHKTMVKKNAEDGMRVYYDWVRGSESWEASSPERKDIFRDNATALKYETANLGAAPFTCEDAKKIQAPILIVTGPATTPNAAEESEKLAECSSAAEKESLPIGMRFAPLPSDTQWVNSVEEFIAKQR